MGVACSRGRVKQDGNILENPSRRSIDKDQTQQPLEQHQHITAKEIDHAKPVSTAQSAPSYTAPSYTACPSRTATKLTASTDELDAIVKEWRSRGVNHVPKDVLIGRLRSDHAAAMHALDATLKLVQEQQQQAAAAAQPSHAAAARAWPSGPPRMLEDMDSASEGLAGALSQEHRLETTASGLSPLRDDTLLHQAREAVAGGRILQADRLVAELCSARGVDRSELAPQLLQHGLGAAQVQADAAAVQDALAGLRDDAGWTVARSDDLRVLYKHHRGTPVHSFKFTATFDAPIEHLLALAREFDLTSTWNKHCLDSTVLAEPTIFESYVYGACWLPPPFPQPDAVLHATGYDLAEEDQSLVVVIASHEESGADAFQLPPKARRRKRATILPGTCLRLEPLQPSADGTPRTKGSMCAHVDPHVPMVPGPLISFVLKVLSPFVYSQMQKVLRSAFEDPGSALPQRVAVKQELYGLVRQRTSENAHMMHLT